MSHEVSFGRGLAKPQNPDRWSKQKIFPAKQRPNADEMMTKFHPDSKAADVELRGRSLTIFNSRQMASAKNAV